MTRIFFRKASASAFSVLLGLAASLPAGSAEAGQRGVHRVHSAHLDSHRARHHHHRSHRHERRHRHARKHRRHGHADAVAVGVAGLVIGTIIASEFSKAKSSPPPRYVYVEPEPIVIVPHGRSHSHYHPGGRIPLSHVGPDFGKVRNVPPSENLTVSNLAPEPWTSGWFDYCRARYRSFDDESGTWLDRDGRRRFCVAK